MRRLSLAHIHFSISAACVVPTSTFTIFKYIIITIITATMYHSPALMHHTDIQFH